MSYPAYRKVINEYRPNLIEKLLYFFRPSIVCQVGGTRIVYKTLFGKVVILEMEKTK